MAVENLGSSDSVCDRDLCASSEGAAGTSLSVVSGSTSFVGSSDGGCVACICDVVLGWAGGLFMLVGSAGIRGAGWVVCKGSLGCPVVERCGAVSAD